MEELVKYQKRMKSVKINPVKYDEKSTNSSTLSSGLSNFLVAATGAFNNPPSVAKT